MRLPWRYGEYSADAHKNLMKSINAGDISIDEFKAAFASLLKNKEPITNELTAMTKAEIFKQFPALEYRYKNEKKDRLVSAAYRSMLDDFVLGDSISWAMGEKYEDVIQGYVDRTTAETIKQYAETIKKREAEDAQRANKALEGIENPQTADDFKRLIATRAQEIGEGATFQQARMALTPEQRARFDELEASRTRDDRKARADQQKTEVRAAAQATDGQVIETKHTKTGEPLFVVKPAERVEADVYKQWNATAKRMGGWYSSYRGGGAVPGFQFKTRENADAFLSFIGGDATQAQEAVQARRDTYADDKNQSAVERLNEMADALEAKAEESLGRERQANTARRARFAASAEASANSDKAMAVTMRNIASAIDAGTAKFLDRVRQKVQIEMLDGFVRTAQYDRVRALYPTEQDKRRREKPVAEVADYATFPTYTAFRSDLARLGRAMLETEGTKKLGQRIMKVADDVSDAYLKFAKDNLHKVSTFKTNAGGAAIFSTKQEAEAVIERSGFKGTAIVLPFKRGQNIIIQSPSEAMKRGIWQGDNDKRITLSAELGAEIVEKIGKANRYTNTITAPWQFESAYEKRKRLSAMGIETPAELRATLREFIELKEAPKEADKIKAMERAMIGRSNDGLDFFPTPASVADEMVAAADIKEGMSVLEPSAGMGHIAERIREAGVDPDVIELSSGRRELLEAKGLNVVASDFMDVGREDFTEELRESLGVSAELLEAYNPETKVIKSGRHWSYITLEGNENKENFDTKKDALAAAKRHLELKQDQFANPQGYSDITAVRARKRLAVIERNMRAGMSEMEAGEKAREEIPVVGESIQYDRIIMNPPFSDGRAAQHVQHAYDLLKPGGRLVAIVDEGAFFRSDKKTTEFRNWLERMGATDEKLEDGAFLDPSLPVNTGVAARMLVIDKGEAQQPLQSRGPVGFDYGHTANGMESRLTDVLEDARAGLSSLLGKAIHVHYAADIPAHVNLGNDALKSGNITRAYIDDADNTIHILADRIPREWTDGQLMGLVKHEVSVHALRMGRGDAEFQKILNQAERLRVAGNPAMQAARDRVPKGTNAAHVLEEQLGYFIEMNPKHGLTQQFMAWFRAMVRKIGALVDLQSRMKVFAWAGNLDEGDLIVMAHEALRNAPGAWNVRERDDPPPVSQSVIDTIISRINGARQAAGDSRISVVFAPFELPAEILKQAKAQNVPESEIHGALHKGRAYIVRQNLKDAQDVEEVLAHEILGHGGVNALLGDKKQGALLEAFNRAGGLMGIRATARRLGVYDELNRRIPAGELTDEKKAAIVDEMLALAQGKNAKLRQVALEFIGKIRDFIIAALDKAGLHGMAARLERFDATEAARMLRQMRDAVIDGDNISGDGVAFMTAWHGSPHDFDRFDTAHIGNGEGNQAFGWGLYFSSMKDVAENYRDNLSQELRYQDKKADRNADIGTIDAAAWAVHFSGGNKADAKRSGLAKPDVIDAIDPAQIKISGKLYQVELPPTEDELLDWDNPLSKQSEKVKAALRGLSQDFIKSNPDMKEDFWGSAYGMNLYSLLAAHYGSDKDASEYLRSIGIRGIKYLDGASRFLGGGSHNYVIFSNDDVKVEAKFSRRTGATQPPHTAATLKAAMNRAFSKVPNFADALLATGKVRIITADQLPEGMRGAKYSKVHDVDGIKIIENPTREQAINLAARSEFNEIRGIIDPDSTSVFIFPAMDMLHGEAAGKLGLDYGKIQRTGGAFVVGQQDIETGYRMGLFSGERMTNTPFPDAHPEIYYSSNGRVLAYVVDGNITFVADNIDQNRDSVKGLLLHELGVHALQAGRSDAEFQSILDLFERMKPGNAKIQAAFNRVPKDTDANLITEEALGYFVEKHPDQPLAKRVIAWVKAQIRKLADGIKGADKLRFVQWANTLTDADILYMVTAATRRAPETLAQANRAGTFMADQQQRFYSQLRKVIAEAPDKVFTSGGMVKMWLLGNSSKLGVKKEEIQWTGITDWLEMQGKGKVSKADVLAYLDGNGVKVEEVVLGKGKGRNPTDFKINKSVSAIEKAGMSILRHDETGEWYVHDPDGEAYLEPGDAAQFEGADKTLAGHIDDVLEYLSQPFEEQAKFSGYRTPGGNDGTYRELLLTLPIKAPKYKVDTLPDGWTVVKNYNYNGAEAWSVKDESGTVVWRNRGTQSEVIRQVIQRLPNSKSNGDFRSSHFDQPNILAHVRFDERTDADGNRVLFLQELQSDWGVRQHKLASDSW